mmetsp:Transcript_27535/g.59266  ORF Transcript_27535/g.59266 Transcript_27535/m.59266 type:complete len:276 (+) Transcript_27535:374-1201(+)
MAGVGRLEEAGRKLDEPLGIDGHHLTHVLLGGEHELVVEDPLGVAVEDGGGGVDVDDLALVHCLVALLRILLRRVHEVARGDGLAHLRVVLARRDDLQLVAVHDSEQLLAHVLRLPHRPRLDEVLEAPRVGELGVRPGLIDGEVGQVVALGLEELCALGVGLCLLLLGPVPDILDGEHRDERENLLRASKLDRLDEHLRHLRCLQRELGHTPTEAREEAFLVERVQREEALHGHHERLHGRRVHEVKVQQVVDAHRLHLQHGIAQVGALDLRYRG